MLNGQCSMLKVQPPMYSLAKAKSLTDLWKWYSRGAATLEERVSP